MVESCKLSLRTLKLARCTNVDDQALDVISRRCVGLRALDLNGCTKVTDQGIKNLARLRTVQSLGLSATQLTDDGCMFVAEQAITRTLGELAISNCAKVSDVGATALISSCKHLKMFMHHVRTHHHARLVHAQRPHPRTQQLLQLLSCWWLVLVAGAGGWCWCCGLLCAES